MNGKLVTRARRRHSEGRTAQTGGRMTMRVTTLIGAMALCLTLALGTAGTAPSLDKLRKATINWVMQPLGKSSDKHLDQQFWLASSDRLMYEGKAPELADTKAGRMPAFFEHSNVNLPQYA
jgi:hypothetical protein